MPDTSNLPGVVTHIVVAAPSYWWVSPLVTAAASIGAGFFAWWSIRANRQMARMRATLDLIERKESQEYYQELADNFKDVRTTNGFEALENPSSKTLQEQRAKVLAFLNHYELIAVGCNNAVLDKVFYSEFMRSAIVRDWKAVSAFIEKLRGIPGHENPALYEYFEAMALEWEIDIKEEENIRAEFERLKKTHDEILERLEALRDARRTRGPRRDQKK